jgi:hypothetical protein
VATDGYGHFVFEAVPNEYILKAYSEKFYASEKDVYLKAGTPGIENITLKNPMLTTCSVCPGPDPVLLELPSKSFDLLLLLKPLPPYQLSAKSLKHLQR